MTESLFYLIVWIWILAGLIIFPVLINITAPYGRHTTSAWGPVMDSRTGWVVMELPALLVFTVFFIAGKPQATFVPWIFFSLWIIHYSNRTLIFPFRFRTKERKMPVVIVIMGIFFNLVNGFINGYYFGFVAPVYEVSWLYDIRFIIGIILFISGFLINQYADIKLIHLRKPGETGYKIPYGGLFNQISCPNHFGEVVEWTGFAIMVWGLPAVAFAVWTATNLIPRAIHHHRWYRKYFPDYPENRKAVIPFLV
jgi:hypothetical protein